MSEIPFELRLLSVKQLADAIGRSERYIWYMRRMGFKMPRGRASLKDARDFLATATAPCGRRGA